MCWIKAISNKTEAELKEIAGAMFHLSLEIQQELTYCKESGGHIWQKTVRLQPTWQCTKCNVVTREKKE